MVKKLISNPDMAALVQLKGSVNLCDTCVGCEFMKKIEDEIPDLYTEAPRHALHMVVWSCNQYRKRPKTRGRPKKTSNP